jgi:hypothetical protein
MVSKPANKILLTNSCRCTGMSIADGHGYAVFIRFFLEGQITEQ